MSPVNAQTDFGDALDDTWDEKLTGFRPPAPAFDRICL